MSLLGRVELLHYGRSRKKCQYETDLTRRFLAQAHLPKKEHDIKFYNQAHQFYCGIDLHANSMHVCVVDHAGNKQLHKNFDTNKLPRFFAALQPYENQDLIIGCESTFYWHWLADVCHQRNLNFLLGHALYLKAIHGGKTKSDRIDSEKLAMLLRGGNFSTPVSHFLPYTGWSKAPPVQPKIHSPVKMRIALRWNTPNARK